MKTALNENFMPASEAEAREGLMNLDRTNLHPGLHIYRFGCTEYPKRYFTSPWWVGFSPFEALKQYAAARRQSLFAAAQRCLAIGSERTVNVLHEVVIRRSLAAWSGTPKTQIAKVDQRYGGRQKPDRDVTQLHIPGLDKPDPGDSSRLIWENAFFKPLRLL